MFPFIGKVFPACRAYWHHTIARQGRFHTDRLEEFGLIIGLERISPPSQSGLYVEKRSRRANPCEDYVSTDLRSSTTHTHKHGRECSQGCNYTQLPPALITPGSEVTGNDVTQQTTFSILAPEVALFPLTGFGHLCLWATCTFLLNQLCCYCSSLPLSQPTLTVAKVFLWSSQQLQG